MNPHPPDVSLLALLLLSASALLLAWAVDTVISLLK
jgi:hypothetical protein